MGPLRRESGSVTSCLEVSTERDLFPHLTPEQEAGFETLCIPDISQAMGNVHYSIRIIRSVKWGALYIHAPSPPSWCRITTGGIMNVMSHCVGSSSLPFNRLTTSHFSAACSLLRLLWLNFHSDALALRRKRRSAGSYSRASLTAGSVATWMEGWSEGILYF
jgi:hypothetical protein